MPSLYKPVFIFSFLLIFLSSALAHPTVKRQFYELRIYHCTEQHQIEMVDQYLQNSFLPALHRAGIEKVGVFHQMGNDTAADKKVFVFLAMNTLEQAGQLLEGLEKDKTYQNTRQAYWNTSFDHPLYNRFETILLRAFEDMPKPETPKLKNPLAERVYELRSYESASEKLYLNKVEMFNKGGEITLFKSLGFNAIFYAEVLSGSKMPNLMYMTSFENRAAREEHWKEFTNSSVWKKISGMPEYQHNVSKADIFFLTPTPYSEF